LAKASFQLHEREVGDWDELQVVTTNLFII